LPSQTTFGSRETPTFILIGFKFLLFSHFFFVSCDGETEFLSTHTHTTPIKWTFSNFFSLLANYPSQEFQAKFFETDDCLLYYITFFFVFLSFWIEGMMTGSGMTEHCTPFKKKAQ
jgi:hypothetical protein